MVDDNDYFQTIFVMFVSNLNHEQKGTKEHVICIVKCGDGQRKNEEGTCNIQQQGKWNKN